MVDDADRTRTISSPDDPPAATASLAGATLGRYVLDRELGRGGMGVVYRARDPELGRDVAIKLLHPHLATLQARLRREGRAIAKLQHPNIVTIYDVGTRGNDLFIAMELIIGKTLRQWLETKRTWREIVDKFIAAGAGLAAAHAAGIVHRDFKPDNVIVAEDGRVVVTDFGLARLGAEDDRLAGGSAPTGHELTQTGAISGTPAFMSPEQFTGATVDARSDQFSFCVALYVALYDQRPFSSGGSFEELRTAVLEGRVREPSDRRGVPRDVDAAIEKGLARDPRHRHGSIGTLLSALAPPVRRRFFATTVALGLIVILLAALWWSSGDRDSSQPLAVTELELSKPAALMDRARGAWLDDVALSPDRKRIATAERATEIVVSTRATGDRKVVPFDQVAKVEWADDDSLLVYNETSLFSKEFRVTRIGIDGNTRVEICARARLATVSRSGAIACALETGEIEVAVEPQHVTLSGPDKRFHSVHWVPGDRELIAITTSTPSATDFKVVVFGLDGSRRVVFEPPTTEFVRMFDVRRMGSGKIAVLALPTSAPKELQLWAVEVDARELLKRIDATKQEMRARFARDGKTITFGTIDVQFDVWIGELEDSASRLVNARRFTLDDHNDVPSDWSADGKSVMFASTRRDSVLWDTFEQPVAGAEVRLLFPAARDAAAVPGTNEVLFIDQRPSSHFLARSSRDRDDRVTTNVRTEHGTMVTGQRLVRCAATPGAGCFVERWGIAGYEILKVAEPSSPVLTRIKPEMPQLRWAPSPTGEVIVFSMFGPILYVRDLPTGGDRILDLSNDCDGAHALTYLPTGDALIVACSNKRDTTLLRVGLDGSRQRLHASLDFLFAPTVSPDGKMLAWGVRDAKFGLAEVEIGNLLD